jgi:hypothetical protein
MILRVAQAAVCSLWTTLSVKYDTSIVASCNSRARTPFSESHSRKPPDEGIDGPEFTVAKEEFMQVA